MRVRGYADFCIGIEEKGEQAAGRERFRDSEGVGLRANSRRSIIHLSLPAARSPFSGQAVKKSAVSWLHKGWKDIIEPAIKTGGKYLGLYLSQ